MPPPVDVIVEKIELLPLAPEGIGPQSASCPVPPAPTVIGKAVDVTETLLGALG